MSTNTARGIGGLLFPKHVAGIWTEERRKQNPDAPAVDVVTVHNYLRFSKPTPPGVKFPNRYADNPMPEPKGRIGEKQPAWLAEQEPELRAWWNNRKGQGAKGHPKPRKKKQ